MLLHFHAQRTLNSSVVSLCPTRIVSPDTVPGFESASSRVTSRNPHSFLCLTVCTRTSKEKGRTKSKCVAQNAASQSMSACAPCDVPTSHIPAILPWRSFLSTSSRACGCSWAKTSSPPVSLSSTLLRPESRSTVAPWRPEARDDLHTKDDQNNTILLFTELYGIGCQVKPQMT